MKTRALKILAWVTGSVLSLIVLSVIAALLGLSWLGSDQGRGWIAGQIEQRASTDGYTVEIGEIQTLNNRQIALSSLTLSDKDGALIRLKNTRLDYVAESLLAGNINITSLDVEELAILRMPKKKDGAAKQRVMPNIPDLKIDRFRIENITLVEALTGKAETLALNGTLVLSPSITDSAIDIHLLDKISGEALADIQVNLKDRDNLALRVHVQDDGKGLITRLTGLPSLNVDLEGTGTEKDWQGDLVLNAGDDMYTDSRIVLDLSGAEPLVTVSGKSRYEDFTTEGEAKLSFNKKSKQLAIGFFGTLGTPDVILSDLKADVRIDTNKKILLTGKTGTVVQRKTSEPISILEQADFEATAKILKDKILIEKSQIKTGLFEATAQGEIDLTEQALKLTGQTKLADLKMLEPGISGAAQVSMKITGTYEPLALESPIEIKTSDFSTPWPEVDEILGQTPSMKAGLSYKGNMLSMSDGVVNGQDAQALTFSGTWREDQTDLVLATRYQNHDLKTKLGIKGDTVRFEDFTALGPVGTASGKGAYDIKGSALQASLSIKPDERTVVSLSVFGPIDQLSGKGTLEGKGAYPYKFNYDGKLQASGVKLNSFAGAYGPNKIRLKSPTDITFEENGASIKDIKLGLNDGTFTTTGSFGSQDFNVSIIAENIPANLETFPFLFDGRLAGDIALSGPYKNPEGKAQLALKRITIPGIDDTQDRYVNGTVTATYKDSVLQAKSDLQGPAGLQFEANGSLPLTISPLTIPFDKPVKAAVSSSVDLRAITILLGLDEQRITGKTSLDINLAGTLNNPVITGTGNLRNGTYENLLTGTALEDIAAEISAGDNRLHLTSLEGKDMNGGRFTGSASIELKNIRDPSYSFSLDTDHLQLVNLDRMGLTASGNLKSTGDKDKADIGGQITINQAEYYIGEIIGTSSLSSFEIIETNGNGVPEAPAQNTFTGPEFNLAVNINAKNNVFVRGPDLETEWSGDLSVSGTVKEPALKGKMTLIRGQFQLLDTPVNLSKGTVNFINPDPTNPVVDVSGTIKGREMDAILKISGEAQKPEVSLTSEPALPEDEILAKTLFGTSISQLSPVQALRIAQLMAYLSGRKEAGFDPLNKIRRAIGIDTLSVGLDEEKGATLSVGKYVSDRVYIGVDQGATPESSAVRAEIEVTKDIDVETVTGSGGESSLGVNWKHDY